MTGRPDDRVQDERPAQEPPGHPSAADATSGPATDTSPFDDPTLGGRDG